MGLGRPGHQGKNLLFLYLLRATAVNQKSFSVRLARREDIPGIQSCNLQTLPENYATSFYIQHMLSWPQLAFVAEWEPALDGERSQRSEIVGYVLGKMNEVEAQNFDGSESRSAGKEGHITSLAVLPTFRRQGVANQLMAEVHKTMRRDFAAASSSLHVRVSNTAALRLYRDSLKYDVMSVINSYYQDGEDAYLMTSQLEDGTAEATKATATATPTAA